MRPGALLFLAALAGGGAAWFLAVLPLEREAASLAAELGGADVEAARRRARAWPGPTPEQEARLAESLAAYSRPVPTAPLPAGLQPDGKGGYAGTLPWSSVPALLAWAADQARPVLALEVQASPGNHGSASCRIQLGPERTP
ncbi:MAG: hypothetical protein L6R43_13525 [Planctomycetes bacterium]|nr:hypothetical protein [Planctomycetota bacterium]